jgi:hypothetical protein
MKKQSYFLTGFLCILSSIAFAQVPKFQTLQIGNTSTNTINASAALQIDDTNRGFLLPRMTTVQRTAIANPARGLQVYDTTTNSNWFYNGTSWDTVGSTSGSFYSSNGTLTTARTVIQGTNTLAFTSSATTGTSHFTIDGTTLNVDAVNNRIGIGTAAPAKTLEVIGEIKGTRLLAYGAGGLNTNVAIGENSLANASNSGNYNLALGAASLQANTSGSSNVAIGAQASIANTTGSNNVALGRGALINNTTGSSNVVLGALAGFNNADDSSATSMNDSILIGTFAAAQSDNQTNQIAIGSNVFGLGSNTVVLGNDAITTTALKGNVGIGTTEPTAKLDVAGAIKVGYDSTSTYTAGMIRFNTTSNKFEGYDGTTWQSFN